jgi:hypothetical protein
MVVPTEPEGRGAVASFFIGWLGEGRARRLKRGAQTWSAHTLMACVFLLGIWGVEQFSWLLWGKNWPVLFGWFPLQCIFHAADAGVLAVFLFYGGYEAIRAYIGE